MKIDVLVAEIGSTTTVVNAFDHLESDNPVFLGQGQAPTSVKEGDVNIGLQAAIEDMKKNLHIENEKLEYTNMLATSSAAGGLRMTVHGLVYDMTVKAAKEAALGAGANIHLITAGKLSKVDMIKLDRIKPNIILIAGGARITNDLAKELGYDAGFGPGKYADDVATFILKEMVERGMNK